MDASTITNLVNAITGLIQLDSDDRAAAAAQVKTAQDALTALQAQDASLNDPTLQASVDAALAAAAAATPAPVVPEVPEVPAV